MGIIYSKIERVPLGDLLIIIEIYIVNIINYLEALCGALRGFQSISIQCIEMLLFELC